MPRLLVILSILVLTAVGVAAPAASATTTAVAQASVATTGFRFVDIPGSGVTLKGNVIAPSPAGRYPAVIFSSSWGLNDIEYLAQARALAARGYVVVSYTPRGWWASGGDIDTAGPQDMADLSTVVDWTIANTATDPARIGAAGISYGAGISLLGAAFDRRIRAVAAMSAWTDLVYSLYGDNTRHKQSTGLLRLAADLLGHPGPELNGKLDDFAANRNVAAITDWARQRSAATFVDALNANQPAVLIANSWGDSIFPPNQLADFYARLTGPKRLELRPGDHAVAEAGGLLGLPNDVWTSLYRWFDQYLGGVNTGIASEVWAKPWNAAGESAPDWTAFTGPARRYGLGQIRWWDGTGLLGGSPTTGWSKAVPTDLDTTAGGGIPIITNGLAALLNTQPSIWLPTVDRFRAGVWASERPSSPLRIRGIPKLHLNLTGTRANGTLIAYLYDLDGLGNATLITHAPATWLSGAAGNRTVDLALSATAYDVPAGGSLTLVIDSVDPLYYDENTFGGSFTIAGGSYVDIPVR